MAPLMTDVPCNDPGHGMTSPGISSGRYQDAMHTGMVDRPPMSPLEKVAVSFREARELSDRVRRVVESLVGGNLEKDGCDRLSCGGLLLDLAANADDTASEIRRANDELSRLSKVLGL